MSVTELPQRQVKLIGISQGRLLSCLAMKQFILFAILNCNSLALLLMAGHEETAPSVLPAIACEFDTVTMTGTGDPASRTREWRLWRGANEVEAREVDGKNSEVWKRSPQGQLTYCRVFHPEKRVVDFNPVDLTLMTNQPLWDQISCILSPDFVGSKLKKVSCEIVLDRRAIRYEGESNGYRYEVLWLENEQIPAWVRETSRHQITTTTLKAIHRLDSCPWPHGEHSTYRAIAYSGAPHKENAFTLLATSSHRMRYAAARPSYYPALAK